jgi:hypothetical protein
MHSMELRTRVERLHVEHAASRYMADHHGLIDHGSALRFGASMKFVQHRIDAGEWVRVHRGVYRAAAAPPSPEQTLLAAVWACGPDAVASHRSAAWLWGLLAAPPEWPEVSVPHRQAPRERRITVHRSTDLVGTVAHVQRGVPVTDPARTILDTAGVVSPMMTEPPIAEFEVAAGRYRFDFAWPEVQVAVEVDGWASHSSFGDWTRNLGKDQWAAVHDWVVCHYSWDDVRHRPEATATHIATVLRRRRLAPAPPAPELCTLDAL